MKTLKTLKTLKTFERDKIIVLIILIFLIGMLIIGIQIETAGAEEIIKDKDSRNTMVGIGSAALNAALKLTLYNIVGLPIKTQVIVFSIDVIIGVSKDIIMYFLK